MKRNPANLIAMVQLAKAKKKVKTLKEQICEGREKIVLIRKQYGYYSKEYDESIKMQAFLEREINKYDSYIRELSKATR